MQNRENVQLCAKVLAAALPFGFSPQVGLVLGTGLGGLGSLLQEVASVPYNALPAFPQSTVSSHQGRFLAGLVNSVPVLVQQGRCHLYEGKSPAEVCMGVRVLAELGISSLVITNAAGSLNPRFPAGGLMLIDDQINLTGQSPLTGANQDAWGLRFPDMSQLYDPAMLLAFEHTALGIGLRVDRGVYMGICGPQLETRAETRAFRAMGADAIGMSTVLEVIAAKHRSIRVAGVSCLSNQNLPDCMDEASIEDIIAVAEKASADLARLLYATLPYLVGK